MQERKVRKEKRPWDFYTGSLKPELHLVCQGNPSLKDLQSIHPYTFKICKTTQKTLKSHKNHINTAKTLL